MKNRLTQNWTFMRVLRLALGGSFLYAAWMQGDWMPAFIGGLFIYQSLMNVGCAGGNCYVPPVKQTTKTIEDVAYEEVK